MTLRFCDGPTFRRAMIAAVATLDRHAAEVDSLNVFPVPDGDTGRNMLVTTRAALEHAEALGGRSLTLTGVMDALAHGALMGARGNSGVILSQVLRGLADGLKGHRRADGLTLAHALRCGSRAADAAVSRPVEGTILTVVRAAAEAAVATAEDGPSLDGVLAAAVEAAALAVERTPEQLPLLAEAGVVDAGGRGFELLLRGALLGMAEGALEPGPTPRMARTRLVGAPAGDATWGYETMYLLTARDGTSLDIDRMRTQLSTMGESVLVVGDGKVARVHLHSERPDLAIGYALRRGTVSRVTVENMDLLCAGERDERAAESMGADPIVGRGAWPPTAASTPTVAPTAAASAWAAPARSRVGDPATQPLPASWVTPVAPFAVVAVAVGPGFVRAFKAAGAHPLVPEGGGENPSTGELLAAIRAADAVAVVVLPNNPNSQLAAEQAATLATSADVRVVPTRNAAEGLAAVLAVDPRAGPAANADRMQRAAGAVRSFVVTRAARDVRLGERAVKRGQAIALDADDGLLASGADRERVTMDALRTIVDGAELLSIHYGVDADLDEAERIAALAASELPTLTVQVMHGGQPHHAFLVAAE